MCNSVVYLLLGCVQLCRGSPVHIWNPSIQMTDNGIVPDDVIMHTWYRLLCLEAASHYPLIQSWSKKRWLFLLTLDQGAVCMTHEPYFLMGLQFLATRYNATVILGSMGSNSPVLNYRQCKYLKRIRCISVEKIDMIKLGLRIIKCPKIVIIRFSNWPCFDRVTKSISKLVGIHLYK